MRVTIAVGDPAAVKHHRMIQQRAVAILGRLQPGDELREQLDVEGIDFRQFFERLRQVPVV